MPSVDHRPTLLGRRREYHANPNDADRSIAYSRALESVNVQLSIAEALADVLAALKARK